MASTLAPPRALPAPFDEQANPSGILPAASTRHLVHGQVRAMLAEAPAFRQLDTSDRHALEHHMVKIAGYAAECLRDDWLQSERLGQRPVKISRPAEHDQATAVALSAADEFRPAAADQVARITGATLEALSFPEFVADLINGSFTAIVQSSIQQMEAYTRLLEDVSKTVDQFMADNITDNQARDWLVQRYPTHIRLADGEPVLEAAEGADEAAPPTWREQLGLNQDVEAGDADAYEEILVPAARRKLAQNRLQMLSMMVMMGIHRIIVTGGKIRATMSYSVDTTDRAAQQRASDFDFRSSVAGSVGFGPWSASASVSVGYVNSNRNQSESELNVSAQLTGEVEIHFKSDVFELNRFMDDRGASAIQNNTPVPENNPPWGSSIPAREAPARTTPAAVRPIGEMPTAPAAPVPPTAVTPVAPVKKAAAPAPVDGTVKKAAAPAPVDGTVKKAAAPAPAPVDGTVKKAAAPAPAPVDGTVKKTAAPANPPAGTAPGAGGGGTASEVVNTVTGAVDTGRSIVDTVGGLFGSTP